MVNSTIAEKAEVNGYMPPDIEFIPMRSAFYRTVKRLFDIVLSSIGIAVACIPMLIIAIIVKIDSKGPAIFTQLRVGRYGIPFKFYKFRSMSIETPKNCATRDLQNADAYITKVGAFLRKTSLDELPQLFNIFTGKMSFVGPRPVVLTETELIEKRMKGGAYSARPGLTGYAQINGRDFVGIDTKADFDSEYVKKATLWADLKIFVFTIVYTIFRKGINEGDLSAEESKEYDNEHTNIINL